MSYNGEWNGKHGKGAMKAHKIQKRIDAELRNEAYQQRGRIPMQQIRFREEMDVDDIGPMGRKVRDRYTERTGNPWPGHSVASLEALNGPIEEPAIRPGIPRR